ncbi:MAG: glycosyltransferase family 4 protein [Firmicutes bacterium]|nr:glycosyltransferase family 4 protein [Bacillota bacterium]
MKIGFDIQLLERREKTGIAKCAQYLLAHIVKMKKDNSMSVNFFRNSMGMEDIDGLRGYEKLGYEINEYKGRFDQTIYKLLWNFIPIPYSFFFGDKNDVTVFFNYYVPPFVKGKKVTVFHDMVCFDHPETMSLKTRIMLKISIKSSAKRADRIITVSEFSKRQTMKYLKVDEEKIDVMPNGVDLDIFRSDISGERKEGVKKKYGIEGEYLLYLGMLEPRKNINGIIEGYIRLCKRMEDAPKLVLAGGKGWLYESIFEKVKENNLEDKVIFTGYVDGEDIAAMMSAAKVFVFPSIYEGFGIPPLEAMACGTPVITSNNTSLPEVMGDCGILVDPYNYEEIADAMERVLTDEKLRKEMIEKGIERAKLFSWDNSAKIMMDCIERAAEQ